jgi:uncharacterized protein
MEINVSQLLKAQIGATREFTLDDPLVIIEGTPAKPVTGNISLIKTHRGILAKGTVETVVPLECSRCLKTFKKKLKLDIEEEYFPSLDINSGTPMDMPEESEGFTIDDHHILDLREAIRQNALLAMPMKPLCREECAGLCPVCGKDLNKESCDCNKNNIDPRWMKLTGLAATGKKNTKSKKETE